MTGIKSFYSESLPDSTNSRNTSRGLQHYLISGSFWDVVDLIERILFATNSAQADNTGFQNHPAMRSCREAIDVFRELVESGSDSE